MNEEKQVSPSASGSVPHESTPVPRGQIEEICRVLAAETDPTRQRHYWTLLQKGEPSSRALDLALSCIMNPSAPNRGEAVRYLRLCFPDRLPALLDAFAKDPDEQLRYQLSEFLRDADQDAAVGMKIGLLKNASPALQEKLIAEIAELGTLFHLEALQGLKELTGGGDQSAIARAADLLAKRTRSQPAGA
jgi:hypothetical protein